MLRFALDLILLSWSMFLGDIYLILAMIIGLQPRKFLRYLQRTKSFMLVYKHVDNLRVVGYSDSDFGGYVDDLKSTSGYIFTFVGAAIS